jgi:hypothetical protein
LAFKFFKRNKDERQNQIKTREIAESDHSSLADPSSAEFEKAALVDVLPRDLDQIVRGSRRKFTEQLTFNLVFLKEQLPESNIVFEQYKVGSVSKKNVVIAYLKGVANEEILAEIRKRIAAIKAPAILESSQIERNIENSNLSPFPQLETTDRLNVVESALIQGRFAPINPNIRVTTPKLYTKSASSPLFFARLPAVIKAHKMPIPIISP